MSHPDPELVFLIQRALLCLALAIGVVVCLCAHRPVPAEVTRKPTLADALRNAKMRRGR